MDYRVAIEPSFHQFALPSKRADPYPPERMSAPKPSSHDQQSTVGQDRAAVQRAIVRMVGQLLGADAFRCGAGEPDNKWRLAGATSRTDAPDGGAVRGQLADVAALAADVDRGPSGAVPVHNDGQIWRSAPHVPAARRPDVVCGQCHHVAQPDVGRPRYGRPPPVPAVPMQRDRLAGLLRVASADRPEIVVGHAIDTGEAPFPADRRHRQLRPPRAVPTLHRPAGHPAALSGCRLQRPGRPDLRPATRQPIQVGSGLGRSRSRYLLPARVR